jgi:hypothetical protein
MKKTALLLSIALSLSRAAWAGGERDAAAPVVPTLPIGLGQTSAPTLPTGAQAGLTLPTLPASAIPQTAAQGSAAAIQPASALELVPRARSAPPHDASGRVVAVADSPLARAGVPADAAALLAAFSADPSLFPAGEHAAYHDAGLARRLAEISGEQAHAAGLSPRRRATLAAAALLATLDPQRAPGTLPRAFGAAQFQVTDPRARELLSRLSALRFEGEPPLDPNEVITIARASDPSAKLADSVGPDGWTLEWAKKLQFLRAAAPFLGETIDVQRRLNAIAAEQRATASAALGRQVDKPTDADVAGAASAQLSKLQASPYFAGLPDSYRSRIGMTEAVLEIFNAQAPQNPAGETQTARGPPASLDAQDLQGFKRFVHLIIPERPATAREIQAFLQDFMDERGIDPDSARGLALRRAAAPDEVKAQEAKLAGLDPKLQSWGSIIVSVAKDFGVTPKDVEALIKKSGLTGLLAGYDSRDRVHNALWRLLFKDQVEKIVARYPHNSQGDALRELGSNITTRGGKSIEEELREGAFLYVDFRGGGVSRITSGRDPDNSHCDMLFYVTIKDGRWKLNGYRQNRRTQGPSGSDLSFGRVLKSWLVGGGVPEQDLEL